MSGRGKGRGGGKGRSNGNAGGKGRGNHEKPSTKKTLNDYQYYIGSAKQSSDYDNTTEFIINYLKGHLTEGGGDIAKALKQLEPLDFKKLKPMMEVSEQTDATKKAAEEKQFELEHKENYSQHKRRVAKYHDNLTKAYSVIWARCSIGMQQKLQQRKDF